MLKKSQEIKERIKKLLHYYSLKGASSKTWKKKHNELLLSHPEFYKELPDEIKKEHRKIWEPFNRNFDDLTLKLCWLISGSANPMVIPEEIFRTDIELSLNRYPIADLQAHKSFYNLIFEQGIFPNDLLHVIDGEIRDSNHDNISIQQANKIIKNFQYPVVMKPNYQSYGGRGIQFVNSSNELSLALRYQNNIIVQEKIRQHEKMCRFYNQSLNTVRVYLYKSIKDDKIHILGIMPRFGNGGLLDNISSGGMASYVDENGNLCGYALDGSLVKHSEHPISGTPFSGSLPDFENLKKLSLKVAGKLFLLRIVGLDLSYDHNCQWRVIEINTSGHTIRSIQYFGMPFFRKYTGEVIEYCKKYHWANGQSIKNNGFKNL